MYIEVDIAGEEATVDAVASLRSWIELEEVPGLSITQKTAPPRPGEMGTEPMAVLSIILSSAATVQLVRALHLWIKSRTRRVVLDVNIGGGRLRLESDNPKDEQALIREATELVKQFPSDS